MSLPGPLAKLEFQLRKLSHSEEAVQKVRDFTRAIGKTAQRQAAFAPEGALVRRPITYLEGGRQWETLDDQRWVMVWQLRVPSP